MKQFILTEAHLKLLAAGNFRYDGFCEYGSIGLDCKRPFGNSCVEFDMAKILNDTKYLNASENEDCDLIGKLNIKYFELYKELAIALNIICKFKTVRVGAIFEKEEYGEWERVRLDKEEIMKVLCNDCIEKIKSRLEELYTDRDSQKKVSQFEAVMRQGAINNCRNILHDYERYERAIS